MSATSNVAVSQNYFSRFLATFGASLVQLVRAPSHSRRAEAARRSARHVLWLAAGIGMLTIALMYGLDASEIRLMPPRGTESLWPLRILTDFGKSAYVLWTLAALLFAVLIVSAGVRATARSLLLGLGTRLQFLFLAVLAGSLGRNAPLARQGLVSRHQMVVEGDDPADEILKQADEIGAELIAMGSHGRTGFLEFFLGSVSRKVLDRARCPVLVVRSPSQQQGADGTDE